MENTIWYPPEVRSIFKGLRLEIFSNGLPACLTGHESGGGSKSYFTVQPGWA